MDRGKQIKLLAFALSLIIAVACTIMILGIQINFGQREHSAKITAPVVTVGLIIILFIYKLIRKENKTSLLLKHAEAKGKKLSPYFTIGFAYFDYMLYCGILSGLCGIISGILSGIYNTMRFETLLSWSYTLSRMAIVFAVYVLCLVIYTVGNMIAHTYAAPKTAQSEVQDER